jgi:hypothetical protein
MAGPEGLLTRTFRRLVSLAQGRGKGDSLLPGSPGAISRTCLWRAKRTDAHLTGSLEARTFDTHDQKIPPSRLCNSRSSQNLLGATTWARWVAKSFAIDNVGPMQPLRASFRILRCRATPSFRLCCRCWGKIWYGLGFPARLSISWPMWIGEHRDSRGWGEVSRRSSVRFGYMPGIWSISRIFHRAESHRRFCDIGPRRLLWSTRRSPPGASPGERRILGPRLI